MEVIIGHPPAEFKERRRERGVEDLDEGLQARDVGDLGEPDDGAGNAPVAEGNEHARPGEQTLPHLAGSAIMERLVKGNADGYVDDEIRHGTRTTPREMKGKGSEVNNVRNLSIVHRES
jgi:hypothetical protein